jgi:PKD domain-containing protein
MGPQRSAEVRTTGVAVSPPSQVVAQDVFSLGFQPIASFGLTWVGLTVSFAANVTLSGGEIDAGTNLTGSSSIQIPQFANLTLTLLGNSTSISLPTMGNHSIGIPGVSFQYLGVNFGLNVVVASALTANGVVSPPAGGGSGAEVWSSAGSYTQHFTVAAPAGASPGTKIDSSLNNISYALSFGLAAEGVVPILGDQVLNLVNFGALPIGHGSISSVSSQYLVTALPKVESLTVSPTPDAPGNPLTIAASVSGGSGALHYSYSGLPDGCTTANTPSLTCTPSATGQYPVQVVAVDGQGMSSTSAATAAVENPGSSSGGLGALGGEIGGVPTLVVVAAVAVAAGVVGLVFYRRAQRSR